MKSHPSKIQSKIAPSEENREKIEERKSVKISQPEF
jgi:hypothetical protein